jgi:anti-sigma B factor antagonist
MEMLVEELDGGVTKVVLRGRMDIEGANVIDLGFNAIAGSRRKVLIDMSGVTVLASLGIRVLVYGAKTVSMKGGKMALLSPIEDVVTVLTTLRIDSLIPIYHDADAAVAAVSA